MRIISQNGAIDVPYEMSAIRNDDNLIILCMAGETGKGSVIARYSTSEKAEKAMEMLHRAYTGMPVVFQNVELGDDVKRCLLTLERMELSYIHLKIQNRKLSILTM